MRAQLHVSSFRLRFQAIPCQKFAYLSSYVYGVFGAQRSRDCTVTVLVSQIKRGHVTALSQ